jgi:hypothetical protein
MLGYAWLTADELAVIGALRMNFIVFGMCVYSVLGAVAALAVHFLTLRRVRPPMTRGRAESWLLLTAGLVGRPMPLALIGWVSHISARGQLFEEAGIVGLLLAMPLSAISVWFTGELATGPTRRSWRPMIVSFVSSELGFVAGMLASHGADKAICWILGVAQVTHAWKLPLVSIPFIFGGVAAALAYRSFRRECAKAAAEVESPKQVPLAD